MKLVLLLYFNSICCCVAAVKAAIQHQYCSLGYNNTAVSSNTKTWAVYQKREATALDRTVTKKD